MIGMRDFVCLNVYCSSTKHAHSVVTKMVAGTGQLHHPSFKLEISHVGGVVGTGQLALEHTAPTVSAIADYDSHLSIQLYECMLILL